MGLNGWALKEYIFELRRYDLHYLYFMQSDSLSLKMIFFVYVVTLFISNEFVLFILVCFRHNSPLSLLFILSTLILNTSTSSTHYI